MSAAEKVCKELFTPSCTDIEVVSCNEPSTSTAKCNFVDEVQVLTNSKKRLKVEGPKKKDLVEVLETEKDLLHLKSQLLEEKRGLLKEQLELVKMQKDHIALAEEFFQRNAKFLLTNDRTCNMVMQELAGVHDLIQRVVDFVNKNGVSPLKEDEGNDTDSS